MVHCNIEKGSRNQHFQSTILVGREVVTQEYSVYALDNDDNSGQPLRWSSFNIHMVRWCISNIHVWQDECSVDTHMHS